MTNAKILIVDDDESGAAHVEECLKSLGYTVCVPVSSGCRAMESAEATRPDLALVDLGLEGELTGPETGERIGSRFEIPVVYLTDDADADLLRRAWATDPFGYVLRPFEVVQLHLNIQTAVSRHRRECRHRETRIRLNRTIDELKDLVQLMKTVFDSMGEAVLAVSRNGMPVVFNSNAQQMVGACELEEDIHKWADKYGVFQPDGETTVRKHGNPLRLAINGQATDNIELFIRNKQNPDGIHVNVSGRPLIGKTGVIKGGVVVARDVTRLKQAEAELERTLALQQEQAGLMQTIFSSISDGVVVADADGRFTLFNPSAEQIVGIGMLDLPPEQWTERYGVFYPDKTTHVPTERLPLVRAMRGEATDEIELFIRNEQKPDGVYISVSGRPLQADVDGHGGGVIIFRDVTERRLAEEALARAFAQGRLEIVDTILHNIGNAINSVTTGIETVRRNLVNDPVGRRLFALAAAVRAHRNDWVDYIANDPQGRKVMPFIVELAESLSRRNEELMKTVGRVRDRANHIADIVRTQKALASPSSMDRKDVDLHDALSGAVRVLRDSLNKRGIQVAIDCENAPREIRIQESQFHQMLVNLVKNSLEAIDELAAAQGLDETPRIRIRASAGEEFLNLEVIDNGIGIRNKDTRVLFSPGYTTKESGSGLGLHSAANFVIASGGRIEPLSEGTGKGTTMRVTLPLSSVAPHATTG